MGYNPLWPSMNLSAIACLCQLTFGFPSDRLQWGVIEITDIHGC